MQGMPALEFQFQSRERASQKAAIMATRHCTASGRPGHTRAIVKALLGNVLAGLTLYSAKQWGNVD